MGLMGCPSEATEMLAAGMPSKQRGDGGEKGALHGFTD